MPDSNFTPRTSQEIIRDTQESDRVLRDVTARTPDRLKLRTSINGLEAEWPIEIWRLYYTYVDVADPKLYDTEGHSQ